MPRKMDGRRAPAKANGAAVPTINTTAVLTARPAQKVPVEKVDATIDYDAAVVEGKEIVTRADTDQMRLGELADRLEPKYGDHTLENFAKAIGLAACTLERRRSVWRAWKQISAPAPESYAVAQELAKLVNDDPQRAAQLIKDNPAMTKREARAKMRELKLGLKQEQVVADPAQSRRDEQRRWFKAVIKHAEEVIRDADLTNSKVSPQLEQALREVVEPDLLLTLREAAEGLTKLADYLERLTEQQVPAKAPERRPLKRVRFKADAAQAAVSP
jgi:hypothetical protein